LASYGVFRKRLEKTTVMPKPSRSQVVSGGAGMDGLLAFLYIVADVGPCESKVHFSSRINQRYFRLSVKTLAGMIVLQYIELIRVEELVTTNQETNNRKGSMAGRMIEGADVKPATRAVHKNCAVHTNAGGETRDAKNGSKVMMMIMTMMRKRRRRRRRRRRN
jgi:hypothetical protein